MKQLFAILLLALCAAPSAVATGGDAALAERELGAILSRHRRATQAARDAADEALRDAQSEGRLWLLVRAKELPPRPAPPPRDERAERLNAERARDEIEALVHASQRAARASETAAARALRDAQRERRRLGAPRGRKPEEPARGNQAEGTLVRRLAGEIAHRHQRATRAARSTVHEALRDVRGDQERLAAARTREAKERAEPQPPSDRAQRGLAEQVAGKVAHRHQRAARSAQDATQDALRDARRDQEHLAAARARETGEAGAQEGRALEAEQAAAEAMADQWVRRHERAGQSAQRLTARANRDACRELERVAAEAERARGAAAGTRAGADRRAREVAEREQARSLAAAGRHERHSQAAAERSGRAAAVEAAAIEERRQTEREAAAEAAQRQQEAAELYASLEAARIAKGQQSRAAGREALFARQLELADLWAINAAEKVVAASQGRRLEIIRQVLKLADEMERDAAEKEKRGKQE